MSARQGRFKTKIARCKETTATELVVKKGRFCCARSGCSFWLVDCLALMGRSYDAAVFYQRLLGLRNDVGLLAEEYDPVAGQQLSNFPQAFSHIAIASSAVNLCPEQFGPTEKRAHRRQSRVCLARTAAQRLFGADR